MSKFEKRSQARQLRKEGLSIVVIAKKLDVSKSSVSIWCRDINLSEEQFEKLRKNKGVSIKTGQRIGADVNKKKRFNAIKLADDLGKKSIYRISNHDLLLIATALYWCEGSKSDYTSGFIFVNSDPEMVLIMKIFLVKILKIPVENIVCAIQINKTHENRIKAVLNFWQKLLELPNNQFRKPYYISTKINKVYDNHDNYYGVCRLIVKRGMNLKYRMLGLIKAIKTDILSR